MLTFRAFNLQLNYTYNSWQQILQVGRISSKCVQSFIVCLTIPTQETSNGHSYQANAFNGVSFEYKIEHVAGLKY